jgi:hypothetical protein
VRKDVLRRVRCASRRVALRLESDGRLLKQDSGRMTCKAARAQAEKRDGILGTRNRYRKLEKKPMREDRCSEPRIPEGRHITTRKEGDDFDSRFDLQRTG